MTAAQPGSTSAGLIPAGRCDGIAGDAETTTGPPNGTWALVGGHAITVAEALADRDRARRIAVALESEVAALTDALGNPALTHEYDPAPWSSRTCGFVYDDDGTDCCLTADHPVHRTPARVRAELEGRTMTNDEQPVLLADLRPSGAALISLERQRQIDVEGWTVEHDDHHRDGELVAAAMVYADRSDRPLTEWPWGEEPAGLGVDRIRDLTKAGALIAAEIDRLVRAELEGQ